MNKFNYNRGLLGFQKEFPKIKGPLDILFLGKEYGALIEESNIEPPREVAIQGFIYKITSYKDYLIFDKFHVIDMQGYPLGASPVEASTFISVATKDIIRKGSEISDCNLVLSVLRGEGEYVDLEGITLDVNEIKAHLASYFISEMNNRLKFLQEVEGVTEVDDMNASVEKYLRKEYPDFTNLRDFLVLSLDYQAVADPTPLLETSEYVLQEPVPGILGIVDRKTKEVQLLSFSSQKPIIIQNWSDKYARCLWEASKDPLVASSADCLASIFMIRNGVFNLKASLYNLGYSPNGKKVGPLRRTIGRLHLKRLIKKSLENIC